MAIRCSFQRVMTVRLIGAKQDSGHHLRRGEFRRSTARVTRGRFARVGECSNGVWTQMFSAVLLSVAFALAAS